MINRAFIEVIYEELKNDNKIVVLFGPRQVGKTTLAYDLLSKFEEKKVLINGDELKYHELFSSRNLQRMEEVINDAKILFIDEAQNFPEIGLNLKILFDQRKDLKILVTGSSSLDLASKIKEPLTGRTSTFTLYPIALKELNSELSIFEIKQNLSNYLTYGLYPEVLNTTNLVKKVKRLNELVSAYLYKDVLQLSNIKSSDKIIKLLKLLAYQVGNIVSIHEIAKTLGLSSETVNHYIDLLEKSFVVFRLSGYSNNLRKEVSKMDKIYFYDVGVRNMLIDNFSDIQLRNDKGAIFENFILMERIKKNAYENKILKYYFWRTYGGAEIDLVEFKNEQLDGFECKFQQKTTKPPKSWTENYPNATFKCINLDNFTDFII